MPTSKKYYPSISTFINKEFIPGEISLVEDAISDLLEGIRYKDLMINSSPNRAIKNYAITLVLKKLKTDLIGTGLYIVYFANSTTETFIPLEIRTEWGIRRYLSDFNIKSFAFNSQAFLEVLLDIVKVSKEEFIGQIINVFVDDLEPYSKLIDEVIDTLTKYDNNDIQIKDETNEIKNNVGQILTDLSQVKINLQDPSQMVDPFDDEIEYIVESFTTISETLNIDFDVYQIAYETIIKDFKNFDEKLDRLLDLFKIWLGQFTIVDLEELLIPQFSIVLNDIYLALEFPRKWLLPLDANNQIIDENAPIPEDEKTRSELSFNVGSMEYSTKTGFHFYKENSFIFTISMIGKSGLTLEIKNMKLDLSRKTNIPEATADGRPVDFMGVYAQEAIIGLPEKWFKTDNGATLGIFGRNLLIGTGGISGTIGLEALAAPGNPSNGVDEMIFTLGPKPASGPRKGFKIGFSHFHMLWQQNALIESSVKGSITIPNFKQYNFQTGTVDPSDLKINIEALFEQDGDFQITAKADGGVNLCIPDVFIISLDSLEVGKDDDKVYLCVSGGLSFENNGILNTLIKDPIEVKKLCIYSDGSFEIEGGSIPLPASVKMKFGPTEVSVTNLTLGSEEVDRGGTSRKMKYIGFDCGVNAGNIGLDLRADGIAYYFTTDSGAFDHFLKISGIGIDLVIPGSASKETAAVLIQGYLSIKQGIYKGSVAFQMPKAKIAGGASMIMNPKEKAWVVDATLELPMPIPLGPSGLGIYGFRGLFGLRYIAAKEAIGLTADDKWFDYYKKDVLPDGKGVHVGKMYNPITDKTIVNGSSKPISIGAGLSLATTADEGKTFSLQALFLISLPELIFIQGKANILGERVGITDGEPPFSAFVAFSPGHSVEFGLGADYQMRDDGKLVKIKAEVEAGFFMKNSSAWYVNFGTKNKPITTRILDLFNAYSYLMLSASGIEAGFGVDFGFDKKYGPVKAKVGVYLDAWGRLGFPKKTDDIGAQIGAGIALGGFVDVSVWGIGFGISIATTLEATVPQPFRIAGSVEVCVSVKLLIKKFEKCFNVDFVWEKNTDFEDDPVQPLPADLTANAEKGSPISALHIGSGKTYEIDYLGASSNMPSNANGITKVIPLDSYIDIQFEKAVNAGDVSNKIGGVTNAPRGNVDLIPPKPSYNRVTHSYKVKDVSIWAWDDNLNVWVDYHPYEALTVGSTNSGINLNDFKVGFFQKTGKEYNKIRFLAQTPFSYVETSAGDFIPEQMGITSGTLFCKETLRKWHCTQWKTIKDYQQNKWYHNNDLNFVIRNAGGKVVSFNNLYDIPKSLMIENGSRLEIYLPENAYGTKLKVTTFSTGVTIRYFEADHQSGFVQYNEVASVQKNAVDLVVPVLYEDAAVPIRKITIEPPAPDQDQILQLSIEIDQYQQLIYEGGSEEIKVDELKELIAQKKREIDEIKGRGCTYDPNGNPNLGTLNDALANCKAEYQECIKQVEVLENQYNEACVLCKESANQLKDCLERIRGFINHPDILDCLKHLQDLLSKNEQIDLKTSIPKLIRDLKKCEQKVHEELVQLLNEINSQLDACKENCQNLEKELEFAKSKCEGLEQKIKELEDFLNSNGGNNPQNEENRCGTFVHEVCWMSEEDYYYNQSIPGQAAIEEDFQLAQAAIENTIVPIWKPGQKYLIRTRVSDSVNNGSDQVSNVYFGFETKGPIGHFPEDHEMLEQFKVDSPNQDYDQKVEAPETVLKFYLNNQKSYPDPSGKILNRKPLYFKDPKLLLYYNKPYVYHFFGTWPAYNGLPASNGHLEMVIKDPVEDISDPLATDHTSSVFAQFPETIVTWNDEDDPIIAEDIKLYGDMRNPELNNPDFVGGPCWQSGGDPIKPASKSTEIIPKHLKPLKLYTAIIKNNYEGVSKEIHRYCFQTSRFSSLDEHINSYHLRDKHGNTRDAVFTVDINLDRTPDSSAMVNINRALNIVKNDPNNFDSNNESLAKVYSDPYQRLMEGHFKIKANHPSLGLEFNFIHEEKKDRIIAIWINSVEPLNDPKIPFDVLRGSIKVVENGVVSYNYFPLFSKDRSKVVLMNTARNIIATDIKIQFSYLEWNGQQYIDASAITTDNLIQ